MAIVSGISVDYKDNEFHVAYEILNTKSKDDNPDAPKVYIAEGHGKAISEAFYNTSLQVAKTPYLSHLKTLIISEEIAKKHTKEIVDFLLRDNYIRNIFLLVIAKDNSAYEILDNNDVNNPVVSTAIKELIENDTHINNIASKLNFEQFVVNIIDPKKDTYASTIKIKDGVITLDDLGVFKKYKLVDYLTEKESATFNIMANTSSENQFKIKCPNDENKFIVFSSYESPKSGINVKDKNKIELSTEFEVKIKENHCEYDFKKEKTYEELQKKLNKQVEKEIKALMDTLIENESDILKVGEAYFKKYKKETDFTKLKYTYKAQTTINRNGLIYEVKQ